MQTSYISSRRPLYWLAMGAFAVVMEAFMIAPLLPNISTDLSVDIAVAGLLVTVFAFVYAFSSPVLTTLTGNLNRRRLMIVSLAVFAAANVAAWLSTSFLQLMAARVLLACAAGLYVPSASAVAGSIVPPEQRGRALATVTGGASLAIALGVPLGSIIATFGGWRATFASVAILGVIATLGLVFGLSKKFGEGLPTATLGQRIDVARRPPVLMALMSTFFWATGAYVFYTYIAEYLGDTLGPYGPPLSVMLFAWGVSAVAGMVVAGNLTDKLGYHRCIVIALTVLIGAFVALSAINAYVPQSISLAPVIIAVVLWGMSVWGFIAPQQSRFIAVGGVSVAPVTLSLHASFQYLGFSFGSALGAYILTKDGAVNLGWVAAVFEAVALAFLLVTEHSKGKGQDKKTA